jgi:hypothetical protein
MPAPTTPACGVDRETVRGAEEERGHTCENQDQTFCSLGVASCEVHEGLGRTLGGVEQAWASDVLANVLKDGAVRRLDTAMQ